MTGSSSAPAPPSDLWHHYGRKKAATDHTIPDRLYWAWDQTGGPGCELLGDLRGSRVADLGAGSARQAAHLVQHHSPARVDAVDSSPAQHQFGSDLYARLRSLGLNLVHAEAVAHLRAHPGEYQAAYSLFGAVDFTDPRHLLPAIHAALAPGGLLLFSTLGHYVTGRSPESDVRAAEVPAKLPDGTSTTMLRWVLDTPVWEKALTDAGFTGIHIGTVRQAETDPTPSTATTIATARKAL
ncbi:class I SAM-dependent methyltransferase [Streptomyces sp. NBC_01615]|uniref:class I SAM-dependent methyltransferase n=1 Tax=Streptomyces sp. NBC_01615 TaxID=2975898 RepID=UPI003864C6BE